MFERVGTVIICGLMVLTAGCAGMKVVNPNDQNKDAGTQMLDFSSGKPKLVSTVNCRLKSMGKRYSASAKTEKEARKEVLARCQDGTVISNCKADQITCQPN